jgi:hypothetical protein
MVMKLAAISLAVLMTAGVAHADTLIIDKMDSTQGERTDRPARGATMARVESNFGTPLSKQPAVGDPPIASWEYTDFTVYFEYDRVLHSVDKPTASEPAQK